MPRALKSGKPRHDPLHVQLDDDELLAKYGRVSQPGKRKKSRQSKNDGEEDANSEVQCQSCHDLTKFSYVAHERWS